MPEAVIVVPCYNEARRLDGERFAAFLDRPGVRLLFVDDGSTDETAKLLEHACGRLGDRAALLRLPANRGKAEAVRLGLRHALAGGADVTGYFDADLATPPEEMLRLIGLVENRTCTAALAARVRLLGTAIRRRAARHYVGRVFATLASLGLGIPVYDTQCGAKAFRRCPALEAALAEPFVARWVFDVELIGRLLVGAPGVPGLPLAAFAEMPLAAWHDVPGSKLRASDFPRAGLELFRIWRSLRRRAVSTSPKRRY